MGCIAALGAEMTNDDEIAYFKANPPPVIREIEDKKINMARKIFQDMKHQPNPEELPPLKPQDVDIHP